jgi:hypothetical protein
MTVAADDASETDVCYRCGYDLRGVDDEQPCPECGLLAMRSRRPTDELHHTRPGWLRRLSAGVILILLSMGLAVAAPIIAATLATEIRYFGRMAPGTGFFWYVHGMWLGADLAALALLAGVLLLTTPEGHPPADRQDAWRRRLMRILSVVPLIVMAVQHVLTQSLLSAVTTGRGRGAMGLFNLNWTLMWPLAVVLSVLVLLLYFQLRSLAKRARSAHLAEHCVIVGVGNAATLLYVPLAVWVLRYAAEGAFGDHWVERSSGYIVLLLSLGVTALLFAIWNLYLLISFAVAFARAGKKLRTQWRQADHAQPVW